MHGYRWNPAPGWPEPVQGWTPPPGWQPDPSWPQPPDDWQFWILDPPSGSSPAGYGLPAAPQSPPRATGGFVRRHKVLTAAAALFLALVTSVTLGTGKSTGDPASSLPNTAGDSSSSQAAPPRSPARPVPGFVSRATMGDQWPLTVDSGVLSCFAGGVYFTTGGTRYTVNGIADSRGDGADIAPIWSKSNNPGPRKNIGPLIDTGLGLCN
ncbi:MAG: DUF2511 domain-containing protein [Sporichthyaceae bacterium]